MFSFHKPKIYRSLSGCCICRAKSSSSRFTDSKRYETDFEQCFKIHEERSGEICNACVLLVKRWKKLPHGSNRNWHHVVDARAGPGTKSMYKIKCKSKEVKDFDKLEKHKHKPKKHKYKPRPLAVPKPPHSPGGLSDDIMMGDYALSDDHLLSQTPSPDQSDLSDCDDLAVPISRVNVARTRSASKHSRTQRHRRKSSNPHRYSALIDFTYWKKTEVCCGIIFKGANGEVLVDPSLMHPCRNCKPQTVVTPASDSLSYCGSQSTVGAPEDADDDADDDDDDDDLLMDEDDDIDDEENELDSIEDSQSLPPLPSTMEDDLGDDHTVPHPPTPPTSSDTFLADGTSLYNEVNSLTAVLDLSLPTRKTATVIPIPLRPQQICIEMEV